MTAHQQKPGCIQLGLSRSGSTVTWQVCKDILHPLPVSKTHDYKIAHEASPVVISVRHPFDAAVSYFQASNTDGGPMGIGTFGPIISSAMSIMKCLESHTGPIHIVRYEDWFPDVRALTLRIVKFLNVEISSKHIATIVDRRSYDSNTEIADRMKHWATWDEESFIHGNHMNGGESDKWQECFDTSTNLEASQKLSAFMQRFGYTL